MLLKIHKDLKNPPDRPIVSSIDSPTEKISHMLDLILQPLVMNTRSYIRDTPHLIKKIMNMKIAQDDWFLSLDIAGLYTNIPHERGIQSIQNALKKMPLGSKPEDKYLIMLLQCVLKMNNFTFNGRHYLQINGTAIGTQVTPTYANLFMNDLEESYIYTHKNCPEHWFRFIDDIFSIFHGSEEELLKFVDHLNNIHDSIKFTANYSKDKIQFLDLWIKNIKGSICTDLFIKPTDSHSYLDYNSCHPIHMKRSIPHSQFLRV